VSALIEELCSGAGRPAMPAANLKVLLPIGDVRRLAADAVGLLAGGRVLLQLTERARRGRRRGRPDAACGRHRSGTLIPFCRSK